MHEVSVMSDIISRLLDALEGREVERVEKVMLEVGELTFLGKDQLQFAYQVLSKETFLEGSELVIHQEEARVRCSQCGYEGSPEDLDDESYHFKVPLLDCPQCGSEVDIVKGRGCSVTSLEVIGE